MGTPAPVLGPFGPRFASIGKQRLSVLSRQFWIDKERWINWLREDFDKIFLEFSALFLEIAGVMKIR